MARWDGHTPQTPAERAEKSRTNASRYYQRKKQENGDVPPKRSHTRASSSGIIGTMLASAKFRAKRDGHPFSITREDIVIPERCPILNTEFTCGVGKACSSSPSLDKVIPSLGYIPGNVRVISTAANRLKDANTEASLLTLLAYVRGEI